MIGFTTPRGERFLLVGSHTSTVREGQVPSRKPGCVGCHLSPLERAKASYRPMRSLDEILGLERERRPAQGMAAASAGETRSGSTEGNSPVPPQEGCAQNTGAMIDHITEGRG